MLQEIELRQFRCHRNLSLQFQSGWNLLLGSNGEGKSSILEAIYFLGRLKSYRTAQIRELVQWQEGGFHLSARQTYGPAEEKISVRWEKGARTCQIDGFPVEQVEEFWGRIPLVLLGSEDQLLVRGPASRRQQWLDSLVAYRKVHYLVSVQRYNMTLRQRNAWLRQGAQDRRLGDVLTSQLTTFGQEITEARSAMLLSLQPLIQELVTRLLPKNRVLELTYRPSFSATEKPAWLEVAANEHRLGRTLLGPHRDEIILTLQGQNLAKYGSEGEQRLGSLLLRLTEVFAIHQARGVWPLLLLDDVLNPLDAARKAAWIQEIPREVQIISATTAWPQDFTTPEKWVAWELRQGGLYPLS